MTQLHQLRVFTEARKNIRTLAEISTCIPGFADLKNQVKRAAISVASNIAEASGCNTKPGFIKFLGIARASNSEMLAQIMIIGDLNPSLKLTEIESNIEYVGKMLTRMIQYHRKT